MKLFASFLFSISVLLSHAQQYNFIPYSVKDNLAQSQVTDIVQDGNGYLWIGTESGGLSRFDGVEFVNFSMDDGLVDNKIEKLFIDSKGILWIATSEGLSKYENRKFIPYYFTEPLRINDIEEFKNGLYLASNTGLIKFESGNFKRLVIDYEEDLYLRSIVNYKDSVLICGSKIGLYTWQENSFSPIKSQFLFEKNILDVQVNNDMIYASVHKEGLYKLKMGSDTEEYMDIGYTKIRSIFVDDLGLLGVTIGYGAISIEGEKTFVFDEKSGLASNQLNCIYRDNENNIWIGSDGKGLFKFSGKSIVYYSTKDSLSSDVVVSIEQDQSGMYYFGTYGAGITFLDKDGGIKYLDQKAGLSDNTVWSLLNHGDSCWIGTARGLDLYVDGRLTRNPMSGLDTKIRTIVSLNDSTLVCGGDEGIFVIDKNGYKNYHSSFNIYELLVMNKKLYCGGKNGLFEFNPESGFDDYYQINLPENAVNTLTADMLGHLWIGTENGLFVMNNQYRIYQFELDPGEYNSKTIFALITNHENDVWVSTMNGVYEIMPTGKLRPRVLHYGIAEGMIDLECNGNALFEDADHQIWVGTSSGLVRIDPSLNHELFDYKAPSIRLTGLRLFMEEFEYDKYDSEMDAETGIPISIVLPYNKNYLTFDFIGINLKDPASVQYEYRLVGANEQWAPLTSTRNATYSFLQPGEYDFEVKATNKREVWSETASMHISILPPFWKTWWFILFIILASLLIIVVIFQIRIRALKQKQENEQLGFKNRLLFLEQQSLNASMNRHFIFNSLNSIQYYINSSDKVSANKYLSSFAKLIRMNLDSSSANNFIVTLQEELDRVELYLSLEKMRFRDKFDYSIELGSGLDTENIEIPSMILQPFIENSIIHGVLPVETKGNITVKIYEELGDVVFEVLDDGVGIDNSLEMKKESMIGDHKSKGMYITNRRIELLRKITGENLMIIGPFQLNDEDGNCKGTKVIIKMGLEGEGE